MNLLIKVSRDPMEISRAISRRICVLAAGSIAMKKEKRKYS